MVNLARDWTKASLSNCLLRLEYQWQRKGEERVERRKGKREWREGGEIGREGGREREGKRNEEGGTAGG